MTYTLFNFCEVFAIRILILILNHPHRQHLVHSLMPGVQCGVQLILQCDVERAQTGDTPVLPQWLQLQLRPQPRIHDPREPRVGQPALAPKHIHLQSQNFQGKLNLRLLVWRGWFRILPETLDKFVFAKDEMKFLWNPLKQTFNDPLTT